MRNDTRLKFNALALQIAKVNGVESATQQFTVDPSVQQTLETRIQESSDFLKRINFVPVTELKGEKIGLSIGKPIASRTDTTAADRVPRDPSELDKTGYPARACRSWPRQPSGSRSPPAAASASFWSPAGSMSTSRTVPG